MTVPGVTACEVAANYVGIRWAGEIEYDGAAYGCVQSFGTQVNWNTQTDSSSNGNDTYFLCYERYKETACANCTEGRYAPAPTSGSSGALSCYSCPSGKYLPREGASTLDSCLSCDAGKKSFEVKGAVKYGGIEPVLLLL